MKKEIDVTKIYIGFCNFILKNHITAQYYLDYFCLCSHIETEFILMK